MIYDCTVNMGANINNTGPIAFTQGSNNYNMNVYFRFEDTDMTTYDETRSNTTWYNATGLNELSTKSPYITNTIIGAKNASQINTSTGSGPYTLTIYSQIPTINAANATAVNIYLYVRVELPMAANLGFSYVGARLDTSSII